MSTIKQKVTQADGRSIGEEGASGRIRATWNGAVIAQSERTIIVEGNHYFPVEHVRAEYLRPSSHTSFCPWKGTAAYHTLRVEDEENPDAAWYYPEPMAAAAPIKDRIAFWRGVELTTEM
ncbi:MAG: DUF427 domain-containing protein [Solirubrobacteraceae bacterium]